VILPKRDRDHGNTVLRKGSGREIELRRHMWSLRVDTKTANRKDSIGKKGLEKESNFTEKRKEITHIMRIQNQLEMDCRE